MVRRDKERIMITVPRGRLKMIRKEADRLNLTISQYLVNNGTQNYENWLKLQENRTENLNTSGAQTPGEK